MTTVELDIESLNLHGFDSRDEADAALNAFRGEVSRLFAARTSERGVDVVSPGARLSLSNREARSASSIGAAAARRVFDLVGQTP